MSWRGQILRTVRNRVILYFGGPVKKKKKRLIVKIASGRENSFQWRGSTEAGDKKKAVWSDEVNCW